MIPEKRGTRVLQLIVDRLRILYVVLLVLLGQMIPGMAQAGIYDGAMRSTDYRVFSGDVNGDGREDILIKAHSRLVMLPFDDDLIIPLNIKPRSPSFMLLSSANGFYELVADPDTAQLAFAGWTAANYSLVFGDAQGADAGSVSIKDSAIGQGDFVVAMSAASGQLALVGAPVIAPGTPSTDPAAETPPLTASPIITPHLDNADAGALPGAVAVSNSGTATYAMELVVPPGTNGMQPALSLNYSSAGQNGPMGLGWSLSGLSSIHRCGKTIAQDGVNDRISFSITDRLCLDGQRLVLANRVLTDANYWAAGAQYRTEIESFTRVTAENNGPGGMLSFRAETRDGRISTYGTSADSSVKAIVGSVNSGTTAAQPAAKSGPQSWALARVADRVGNFISYAYEQDGTTGEHHVSFIRYGGAGQAAHGAVQFVYEARQDAWKRYIDESRNDLRSRVAHIKTYVGTDLADVVAGGTLVRDYALSYELSPSSGRSLLNSVTVCARNPGNGGNDCLPPTVFSWGKPVKSPGFVSRGMWAGAPILTTNAPKGPDGNYVRGADHADYFAFSDFDHDGFTDVLEKRVASMIARDRNTYEGNMRESTNPLTPGTMRNQYRYFHNTGSGFAVYNYRISTGDPFVVMDVGDFNGDGSLDLLVYSNGIGNKICLSPLGQPGALGAPGSTITFNCRPNLPSAWRNESGGRSFVFDAYGDGRAAVYSTIKLNRTATFCTLSGCQTDNTPPEVLGFDERFPFDPYNGATDFLGVQYNSFTQMVDFTGTGKPHDVRWSEAFFQQYTYDGFEKLETHTWYNLTAKVTITSVSAPGIKTTGMEPYTYRDEAFVPGSTVRPFYSFDKPYQGNGLSSDFNGSGYNGLAFGYIAIGWYGNVGSNARTEMTLCLSTGRALDCGVRQKYSGDQYRAVSAVGNFVGDGMAAIMALPLKTNTYGRPSPSGAIEMCRVMGDDTTGGTGTADANIVCTPWSGTTLPVDSGSANFDNAYFLDLLGTGRTQLVYYHGGKISNNQWHEDGRWELFEPIDVAADGQALDRIVGVTNGLGATASVEYAEALTSGVVGRTDVARTYPQQLSSAPGKVVKRLIVSNGVGANQQMGYQYYDAAIDVAGRGALGYRSVVTTDELTEKVTSSIYSQQWQSVGMLLSAKTVLKSCEIASSTSTIVNLEFALAGGARTYLPQVTENSTVKRDLNCSELGTVTTKNGYGDSWGNLTWQEVSSAGGGGTFSTTTIMGYRNDETRWLIGLPERTVVKKTTPTLYNQEARTTSTAYDEATGLRNSSTVEPDDARYRLVTNYLRLHNVFGLVDRTTQQWTNAAGASQARIVSEATYDANGRYPVLVKNGLGQAQTLDYYPGTGVQKSLLDANGQLTTSSADGFGRVRTALQANGNETRTYQKACQGDCVGGAVVAQVSEMFHGATRIGVPTVVYSDSAGHVLRTMTWGFDGRAIVAEQRYDSLGRLAETDWPRFEQQPAFSQSTLRYDELDRVIATTTLDEQGSTHDTLVEFNGDKRILTNTLGQQRKETRDVLGQVTSVKDANGNDTSFDYEAFGGLSKTTDPYGNIIPVAYDRLGRKTHLYDPDLGHIEYGFDPPGRAISQISPKQRAAGQSITFQFDDLDRMTARFETDLESHWVFDTAAKGVGQLAQAYTQTGTLIDYRRVHTYDAYARPSLTTQILSDGSYTSKSEYDAWGRPLRQTYQRNTGKAKVFAYRYSNTGHLASVMRGNLTLWSVTEQDAQQRPVNTSLGNGLAQLETYNPYSGRLTQAVVSTAAGVARLQEGYDYDLIGNVLNRTQYWDACGFQEAFHYDAMNRIDSSSVLGQPAQSFTYDNVGNLRSKTGVGSYTYPPQGANSIRPHAVQSTSSQGGFVYDVNGNLITGAGRTMTWTSFDMPSTITGTGASASFVYGPEHQRVRQNRGDGSTVVYAGAQEVESKGGQVTVKTYWPNGIGVEIDRPNVPATELNWTHTDRLGSPVALSGENGALREKLAYDAWGKRRELDGSVPSKHLVGEVDNRGFTGHEMLDQLDLVHMNGRIYDPWVGRFVSGDPLVSDPVNGQSYNRYSYVLNNPTNSTDPTGFEDLKKEDLKKPPEARTGSHIPGVDAGAKCLGGCVINTVTKKDGKADSVQLNRPNDAKGSGSANNGIVRDAMLSSPNPAVAQGAACVGHEGACVAAGIAPLAGGWLASTKLGQAALALFGFGSEVQSMADGVPSAVRGIAGAEAKAATAEVSYSMQQLDKKFKHASDFGLLTTKKNPETLGQFQSALKAHANDPATIGHGTYGFVNGSRVLFNANTNNAMVVDKAGQFVTGFKLAPGTPQYQNYLTNGILR